MYLNVDVDHHHHLDFFCFSLACEEGASLPIRYAQDLNQLFEITKLTRS